MVGISYLTLPTCRGSVARMSSSSWSKIVDWLSSGWQRRIEAKLDQLITLQLQALQLVATTHQQEAAIMATVQEEMVELTREVEETKGVTESAKVLIVGLRTKVDELISAGGPVSVEELRALRDALDTNEQGLANALAANPIP